MRKEDEYHFIPVCVLGGQRGALMIDAKGVIMLQTMDAATGAQVGICLSTSAEETEAFLDAVAHMLEHQQHEEHEHDPEEKADLKAADMSFEEMMKQLNNGTKH